MAEAKKKRTNAKKTRRGSGAGKNSKNTKASQTTTKQPTMVNEIQGVVVAAVSLLVFACLFIRDAAVAPDFIARIMFGVFGIGAYIVPIALLILGISRIIMKRFSLHAGKIISTVVFVLCICGILHIILTGVVGLDWSAPGYFDAVALTYSQASQTGLPLSMGALCTIYLYPVIKLFGTAATVIILICGVAASVILLFNFSYRKAGKKVKEKIDIMHENNVRRNAERTENRQKKRTVSMFDDIIDDTDDVKPASDRRHVIEEEPESPLSFEAASPVSIVTREFNEPDIIQGNTESGAESAFEPGEEASGNYDKTEAADADMLNRPEEDKDEPVNITEPVSAEFNSFDLPQEPQKYIFPPLSLLSPAKQQKNVQSVNYAELAAKLERTLASFGIRAHVINYTVGPAITRYELTIEEGIRVNKILALSDDIALCMAATGVRIEAPIPGKSAIGIEIPNVNVTMVCLREVLDSDNFRNNPSCVAIGLGKDITGRAIVADIAKMPHLLIAGQTGSGKSVAINSLIVSILYKATPEEVRLILVDPKQVELSIYNGIPHLLLPVVTDPKKAAGALQYVVRQMEKRYSEFNKHKVKDIYRYNEQARANGEAIMPRIIVIVDELNDLMMVCPGEVEDSVLRIAQLARAAGIYLVLATQRPSVNVITGVIKANIPSRMAFAVASSHDSKTILDRVGAERLVGKGDMLYHHNGESKPLRIQGAYVDENDIEKIVDFVKNNSLEPEYIDEEEITMVTADSKNEDYDPEEEGYDELIFKAVDIVMQCEQASISLLQRKLGIGYSRAGRLIDSMEKMNIIGPSQGSKPREILITQEQYLQNFKRK